MEDSYFSAIALDKDPLVDQFKRDWYTKFLKAMAEPAITALGPAGVEIYRFLWLRTFHRPIAVRLERRENDCTLVAKELDGKGGYEPGKISREVSRPATLKERDRFISLLTKACYWEMPTDAMGLVIDGALWLLESHRHGKHHVVNRYCPRANGPDSAFREACLFLLTLADIEIAPSEMY